MAAFYRVTAAVLLTAVISIVLNKQNKDISLVLTMAVSCMAIIAALQFLQPVMDFLQQLQQIGQLNGEMVGILLKAVGIALIAQIAALICTDSGNGALANTIQLVASAVILWQALPLLRSLLELMQKILGEL